MSGLGAGWDSSFAAAEPAEPAAAGLTAVVDPDEVVAVGVAEVVAAPAPAESAAFPERRLALQRRF
jgi:hypothetical protein